VSKSPPKRKPFKPTAEPSVLTFTNLDDPEALTPLNFRVSARFIGSSSSMPSSME
jgi:hypothetical protein